MQRRFQVRLRLKMAVEAARSRGRYLRTVNGWDMIACGLLKGEHWWARGDTAEARWETPYEASWAYLVPRSASKGRLGRWEVPI